MKEQSSQADCDPRRTMAALSLSRVVGRKLFFMCLFLIICLAVAINGRRARSHM